MLITLLTDFGTSNSYVAQMKGVILGLAPAATIVDATHAIPPQDILAGALELREYAMFFPCGTVHVAVVDPGVGTQRAIIAAEIAGRNFVMPNNGLLTFVAEQYGIHQLVVVDEPRFWLPQVSQTFHGRDIMAPVAAHIACGAELSELGPPLPHDQLMRLANPPSHMLAGVAQGCILGVDHFGNAITNLPPACVEDRLVNGSMREINLDVEFVKQGQWVTEKAQVVRTYGQAKPGKTVLLVGSGGKVELAVVNGSAARHHALAAGQEIRVRH